MIAHSMNSMETSEKNQNLLIHDIKSASDPNLDDIDLHNDFHEVNIIDDIGYKVITWNLWCMIFSPRTLSNPQRCANVVSSLAKQEKWSDFNGLIICSFQELWSWKTGLFPPILLRFISYFEYIPYLGILISFIFQFITLLFGVLPILKCLPIFKYNPKRIVSSALKTHVPYSYYNTNIPFHTVLDNGLLILTNEKADKFGCNGYINHACDDSLANKGFIYVYFKKHHTLVLNTHLQSAGDGSTRIAQIEEIKSFIHKFTYLLNTEIENIKCNNPNKMDEYDKINYNKKLKIIATGDWNIDMINNKIDNKLPHILGDTFVKVNGYNPTCTDVKYGSVDHIFANFEFDTLFEEYHGKEGKLSDHLMIKNEFTASSSNLI